MTTPAIPKITPITAPSTPSPSHTPLIPIRTTLAPPSFVTPAKIDAGVTLVEKVGGGVVAGGEGKESDVGKAGIEPVENSEYE